MLDVKEIFIISQATLIKHYITKKNLQIITHYSSCSCARLKNDDNRGKKKRKVSLRY